MAVQKSKRKKSPKKPNPVKTGEFKWTPKRRLAAKILAESTDTYTEIAKQAGINIDTLLEWRKEPVFVEEVQRLVLKHEAFSLAGLLKGCLKGLNIKEDYIIEDKNTFLDYIKEIAELQGYKKQKVELDANVKQSTEKTPEEMTDEELQRALDENLKILHEAGCLQSVSEISAVTERDNDS